MRDTRLITPADVDMADTVPLHFWFHWMQIIAEQHATYWRVGRNELMTRNLAWVLARLKIKLDKPVRSGETVTMETFAGQTTRTTYPRFLLIKDENGSEIGRISSLWALMDFQSRTLALPGKTPLPDFPKFPPEVCPPLPGRVPEITGTKRECLRIPQYEDIDINQHVNNARYPAWIGDMFTPQELAARYIDSLQINYRHEISPATACKLTLTEKENEFSVACNNSETSTLLFEAYGTMKENQ